MKYLGFILTFLLAWCIEDASSQNQRYTAISNKLDSLSEVYTGLNNEVELSVSNTDVKEFIRALSNINKLNVSVSNDVNGKVLNSFSNAKVKDVFLFLCSEYDLDMQIIGSIITFYSYKPPPIKPKPKIVEKPKVYFNDSTRFLSLDFKKDILGEVAEEITKQTGANVILAPGLSEKTVSVFIKNRPLSLALENFAFANNMVVENRGEQVFILQEKGKEVETQEQQKVKEKNGVAKLNFNDGIELTLKEERIFLRTYNQPIKDIINLVSTELNLSYFLFSEPKGNATVTIENATFDEFLTYLLNGTSYTFKNEDNIYLIGEKNLERLRQTQMVQLQNRTVESLEEVIPSEVKKGLEIREFAELNSFVVTGSVSAIKEFESFIAKVDKVVPVVLIEIIIADITRNHTYSTGINAGLGEVPEKTEGVLFPSVDISLNTKSINDLVNSINGFGLVNLGQVTPNFYLSLKALEENGVLKTRSTPKLSTINGHEANLSIGTQEYYLEVSNNVIGTQNPSFVTTQNYRTVNADLSVIIKPIVSGNEHVTLEIDVNQSDFTARISPEAPPGSVSRNFKSTIRVKNNEMILLGGLEERTTNDAGSGVPLLSRIPIIKWLFSSRTKQKGKTKLTIFIKPTVIY